MIVAADYHVLRWRERRMARRIDLLRWTIVIIVVVTGIETSTFAGKCAEDSVKLPIMLPDMCERGNGIRNLITLEQLHSVEQGNEPKKGLLLNLQSTQFEGLVYSGPYPLLGDRAVYDDVTYRKKRNPKTDSACCTYNRFSTRSSWTQTNGRTTRSSMNRNIGQ